MTQEQAIERLNRMAPDAARDELLKCCGSGRWAQMMVAARPFTSAAQMIDESDRLFLKLLPRDWLEAFSHHPKIGDVKSLREKFANTRAWASGEQSRVSAASEETLRELAAGNERCQKKFGHIFIVCATGRSAEEMLAILKERLENDAAEELLIAAEEQKKITRLRLAKMLES